MPDRGIAAEQFERSIHDLDEIVDSLIHQRRRDRIIGIAITAILVFGGVTGGYLINEQRNQQVEACRGSNQRFNALMDILDSSVGSDNARNVVALMRDASVVDCDGDGAEEDDI